MTADAMIVETCTRFGWHVDQREWDALRALFADEVMVDYTSLHGGQPTRSSADDLVAGWSKLMAEFAATQHLIANHLVTVADDTATCTAAFQATHRLVSATGSSLWTLGGSYRFELIRTDRWRIRAVTMTATWGDGNQHLLAAAAGGDR